MAAAARAEIEHVRLLVRVREGVQPRKQFQRPANNESASGPREPPGSPTWRPRWGGPPEGSAAKPRRQARASNSPEPQSAGGGAPAP
jgi:hypothetical protein